MVSLVVTVTGILDDNYFEVIFLQNRKNDRNGAGDTTGLQTNKIYCYIDGLKMQLILNTNIEDVPTVTSLTYKLLLYCHERHQTFQAFNGFSGSFNK